MTGADGNIENATDAGGTITYVYNANGTLSSVTAPGNVTTTFSYDSYGRRTSMNDPSAGTRSDSYAVYGTRHTSINAKGTVQTWMDYTGRVASVYRTSTETGASDAGTFNTSYTYNAYGDLTDVVSISSDSGNNSATHYTYDIYGRPSTVQDVAPDGKSLMRTYSYNSAGQLTSTTYTASSGWTVTESHTYANGYLTQTSAGGNIIWRLDYENDLGQPTQATTGSITRTYSFNSYGLPTGRTMGSVMDFRYSYNGATGNMVSRTDYSRSLTETFAYDSLSRLVSSSGNTADTRSFTYAANGNITQISGLGTLSHSDTNHPYRVTGGDVTGMQNLSYSAAHTAFDRPAVISCTEQESGAITNMAFTYDASHERVRTVLTFDSQSKRDIEVTAVKHYYLGGRYELVETDVYDPQAKGESSITSTKERLYLGGDAYSAPVVAMRTNNSGNGTYYNIGRDVQGSITHIATMSGTLVAEYSYDPWGRLRNPATHALYDALSAPDLMLGRGYTGHEYIPEAGLWNANARLYDPFLGCFLSPDPYVQAPDFTQNLNRYAYALNNPLKYSDESGEFFFSAPMVTAIGISAIIGGITGWAIGKNNDAHGAEMLSYIAGGSVIGAISSLSAGSISAMGGAAWWAGAAAGAISGSGYAGLSANFDPLAMLNGMWKGALSGFVGGGVGSAIGGGWGAMVAGSISSGLNSALNGADLKHIGISSLLGGALSYASYELVSYLAYSHANLEINGSRITYRQFKIMQADYQKSRFWRKEYGGLLTINGGIVKINSRHNFSAPFTRQNLISANTEGGVIASYHTHWAKPGLTFLINENMDFSLNGFETITSNGPSEQDISSLAAYFNGDQVLIDYKNFYLYNSASIYGQIPPYNCFLWRFFPCYIWPTL